MRYAIFNLFCLLIINQKLLRLKLPADGFISGNYQVNCPYSYPNPLFLIVRYCSQLCAHTPTRIMRNMV